MPRRNRNASSQKTKAGYHQVRISLNQVDSCRQKKRYSNQTEAERAAEVQMLSNMNLELSVYHCPICQTWHLTKNRDL